MCMLCAGTKQELQARLTDNDRMQQHAQEGAMVLGAEALHALERQTVRETVGDKNVAEMAIDAGPVLSEVTWGERETALTSAHAAALEVAVQQAEEKAQEMVSALGNSHREGS